jgi:hypothetical protein
MTTPHQGPGMWQQGNERAALAWLASLDAQQQQALQRSIQTHQALGPIYNAVSRVNQVASQQATRLSEAAQRLAQATTNRVTEIGQQAAGLGRQVVDLGERGRDATVDAAQRTAVAADRMAYNAMDRATAAGRQVAEATTNAGRAVAETATNAGRAVAESATNTGRAVADAGRQVAGNVSRWFHEKRSNASNRAQAASAAFAAFRMDPTLQQSNVSAKDVKNLSERAQAILSAQTPEAREQAINQFTQAAQSLNSNQQQGRQVPQSGPESWQYAQNPQQGHTVGGHQSAAARALEGMAPASQAVTQNPAGQQSQGDAAKPGTGRHRGDSGQER